MHLIAFNFFLILCTLGCFNPNLGQIWTNPNVGLIKKCTVECESWVKILNYIFNPTFGFVHI